MSHSHADSGHVHEGPHRHAHSGGHRRLLWVLVLTFVFAGIEALGGLWSHSLALLGDSGHMFSDSIALGIAAFASWVGKRPPSARHSYGLARAEVVSALLNGLLMLAVVSAIVVEAIRRLRGPMPVAGVPVMVIAGAGLVFNLVAAVVLSRGEQTISMRGALVHVMGDLLGSVAALLSGTVVYFTGWTPIDPLLSLLICALILYSTVRLLREALHVLMEGVPPELDLNQVGEALAQVQGVLSVHDLHIWTLSSGVPALSAHVVMENLAQWPKVLAGMQYLLRRRFRIGHVTLQPELATAPGHAVFARGAKVYPLKPENSGR